MDGEVKVFGKNLVLVKWKAGKQWDNKVCRSLNEAENWFCSDTWAGNIE